MKLKRCATTDLVTELARREGVLELIVESGKDCTVKIKGGNKAIITGSAKVLLITD